MAKPDYEIVSFSPVSDWFAIYAMKEKGADGHLFVTSRLVGWALVKRYYKEGETETEVEGLDADSYIDIVSNLGNFLGYIHEGKLKDDQAVTYWNFEAAKYNEKELKKAKG